jgi:predicted glycosyl hydrolase (DUF1957 family)
MLATRGRGGPSFLHGEYSSVLLREHVERFHRMMEALGNQLTDWLQLKAMFD